MGTARAELRHSDRNLKQPDLRKGIFKKNTVNFNYYMVDVFTHTRHIYVQTTCKVNFASDDPFKINLSAHKAAFM